MFDNWTIRRMSQSRPLMLKMPGSFAVALIEKRIPTGRGMRPIRYSQIIFPTTQAGGGART
jgi:hypothetical protein